jgi:hypothetical protein
MFDFFFVYFALLSQSETGNVSNDTVANGMSITEVLASAGHALEGSQAELVLQPLRLAFESKNVKLVEPALDCLHVGILFFLFCFFSECLTGFEMKSHLFFHIFAQLLIPFKYRSNVKRKRLN